MKGWHLENIRREDKRVLIYFHRVIGDVANSSSKSEFSHHVLLLWESLEYCSFQLFLKILLTRLWILSLLWFVLHFVERIIRGFPRSCYRRHRMTLRIQRPHSLLIMYRSFFIFLVKTEISSLAISDLLLPYLPVFIAQSHWDWLPLLFEGGEIQLWFLLILGERVCLSSGLENSFSLRRNRHILLLLLLLLLLFNCLHFGQILMTQRSLRHILLLKLRSTLLLFLSALNLVLHAYLVRKSLLAFSCLRSWVALHQRVLFAAWTEIHRVVSLRVYRLYLSFGSKVIDSFNSMRSSCLLLLWCLKCRR